MILLNWSDRLGLGGLTVNKTVQQKPLIYYILFRNIVLPFSSRIRNQVILKIYVLIL